MAKLTNTASPKIPERESPQHAIDRIVASVLDEVFKSGDIPSEVRNRARDIAGKFSFSDATYLGPEARRAAGQEYDNWIDEIFRATQSGDSREDLLRQFIRKLGFFIKQGKTDTLFALIVEEITAEQHFIRYQLADHLGPAIHEQHWRNFAVKLESGVDHPFFRALLDAQSDQTDISIWHGHSLATVYPYTDEFDDLIRVATGNKSTSDLLHHVFWLSAVTLRSEDADQPHRLIFIAYPNYGTAVSPKVGRAATHEWRMLQLLRIAYSQLDHEIRHLDRRIAAQRGDMIRDLGPGFLAHELHTHLANLNDLLSMMILDLKPMIEHHPDDASLHTVGKNLLHAVQETTRVFQVVHGYNNLMRVRRIERFVLGDVIEEAIALIHIRAQDYAKASVKRERKRAQAISIETDHGLLLVVLVNILVNATQAIQEARPPQGIIPAPADGDRIVILVESEPEDAQVVLVIANTGPEIPREFQERIFKRGYTTRRQGHGQGLYLCRQILQSLGGGITYFDPLERNLFPGAAFRLEFNREWKTREIS